MFHQYWLSNEPEIHPFVMSELSTGHVPMISDNFSDVFRWHVLLLRINETKLALLTVPFHL